MNEFWTYFKIGADLLRKELGIPPGKAVYLEGGQWA